MLGKVDILISVGTRIVVVLEKLAEIESRNADSKIISWKEFEKERMEMKKMNKEKGWKVVEENEE